MVLPVPAVVEVDPVNGRFDTDLLTTDSAQPDGWVWQVTERVGNTHATWCFELPASPDVLDLADVAPVDGPGPGQLQYRGPAGPQGVPGPPGAQGPQGVPGPLGQTPWGPVTPATVTLGAAGLPDTAGADEGDVLQLFGPQLTPAWSDNLTAALNRNNDNDTRINAIQAAAAQATDFDHFKTLIAAIQ
jgi:hypothetical protein